MTKLHVDVFHEMIQARKAVIRVVWGKDGIEGLTLPQFVLLMHIRRNGSLTPSEIRDKMLVTQGNITGLVQRLIKRGWADRRHSSVDKRVVKIVMTQAGIEKLETVIPIWEGLIEKAFKPLSQNQQKQLRKLLLQLQVGLNEPDTSCCGLSINTTKNKKSKSPRSRT